MLHQDNIGDVLMYLYWGLWKCMLSYFVICPFSELTLIVVHRLRGGRHLHEIFNESIIFMSHFSIGMIDIHKKISLRIFFLIQNGRCRWGPKTENIFRRRLLKKYFLQSFIILHLASLGVTLCFEPTIL